MLILVLFILLVLLVTIFEIKNSITKRQVKKYLSDLTDVNYIKTSLIKPTDDNGLLFTNKFYDGSVLLLRHAGNTVTLPQSDDNQTYYLSGIDFSPRKELFVLDGTGATNTNSTRPFMHLVKTDLSDEVVVEIKANQNKINQLNETFGVSDDFFKHIDISK